MSTKEMSRAAWRKSSYSGDETNKAQCVELAGLAGGVGLRDSQAPETGHLSISKRGLADLFEAIKGGTCSTA